MRITRTKLIVGFMILLGITFFVVGVIFKSDPVIYYAHSLRTWQEADSVAGYPIEINDGEFTTAEFVPELSSLTPLERALLPQVTGFEKPNLNQPQAVANGMVLTTRDNSVVLGHRMAGGRIIQSRYSGIQKPSVRVGEQVPRGRSLGDGNQATFEFREGTGLWFPDKSAGLLDTGKFLQDFGLPDPAPIEPFEVILEKNTGKASEIQIDPKG